MECSIECIRESSGCLCKIDESEMQWGGSNSDFVSRTYESTNEQYYSGYEVAVLAGSKVVLQTKVDPAILGGLQVKIGDQFLN